MQSASNLVKSFQDKFVRDALHWLTKQTSCFHVCDGHEGASLAFECLSDPITYELTISQYSDIGGELDRFFELFPARQLPARTLAEKVRNLSAYDLPFPLLIPDDTHIEQASFTFPDSNGFERTDKVDVLLLGRDMFELVEKHRILIDERIVSIEGEYLRPYVGQLMRLFKTKPATASTIRIINRKIGEYTNLSFVGVEAII